MVLDDLLEKNKLCDRRSVRHVTQESEVANGESLKRIVKALFSVRLGNFYTAVAGIITGLSVECILGIDFLQTNGCKVDLGNRVLIMENQ